MVVDLQSAFNSSIISISRTIYRQMLEGRGRGGLRLIVLSVRTATQGGEGRAYQQLPQLHYQNALDVDGTEDAPTDTNMALKALPGTL